MLYLYCQSLIKDIKTTSMPEVISPQSRTRCVLLINDWRLNYRLGAFYTPWITFLIPSTIEKKSFIYEVVLSEYGNPLMEIFPLLYTISPRLM